MTDTAVVILNWNGENFLQKFLPVLISQTPPEVADIYIADNASTDSSVNYIKENFPTIKLIILDKNYGFAGGYNSALMQINADYYVLLNSDIEVTQNWIEPIIRVMKNNQSIAACMPKIKSYYKKTHFEYAGAAGGYIDALGYPFCRGRILRNIEKDTGQYNDAREIFWATGACMFIRSTIFKSMNGFDDDFFAHMEEIDLCWRIKKNGWKILYIPDVEIYHIGGGTLPNENPKKLFLNIRNNLFLLFKNLSSINLLLVISIRTGMDIFMALIYLLQLKPLFTITVFKAHLAFWKNLPVLVKKRKKAKGNKKANCIYRGSILFNYFIRQKKKFSDLSNKKFDQR